MANDKPRDPARRNPAPEIAAAEGLFRDDSKVKSQRAPDSVGAAGADDVFDLADATIADRVPGLSPSGPAAGQARHGKSDAAADQSRLDPSDLVQEVWSRRAEWGSTLIAVGAWVAFILLFVYFGLGVEYLGLSLLTLIVGGVVAAVLSYPIWITLERPVRITPEQAARDYYGALSHHFPHYRRMWLVLSSAGRISTAYGSYEGFKAYWKDRLGNMRRDHAGSFTPLVFEVAEFKADKSAGKVRIDAEFTLKVWVRGRRKAGPIHVIPMKIALARGPDKMWYLEDGTLGREGRAAKPKAPASP
jgi:hypothetical protein